MVSARGLPGRDAIREREVSRLVMTLTRVRGVGVSAGVVILVILLFTDAARGKVGLLAALIALVVPIAVFDVLRFARGGYARRNVPIDIALGAVLQTVVITLTGGIESPVLPAYILLSVVAGALMGGSKAPRGIVGGVTVAIWGFFAAGIFGEVPLDVPRFLGLDPGFGTVVAYSATRAAVINLFVLVGFRMGIIVHRTIDRMLDAAIDARQQAVQTLLERNRELVQLSAAVAHELKNPLASIQGLVQLLEKGGANSERRFEVLKKEISRTRDILDELLEFTRPLGELSLEEVDPLALLDDVRVLQEGLAAGRHVKLETAADASGKLRCDPKKIRQALVNLVQNAIEATPEGGTVRLVSFADAELLSLGVEDSGPGFLPGQLERPLAVGQTTKPGGHGIGLTVVRAVAEQHGGRLVLTNVERGGARALLCLPRNVVAEVAA